MSEPHPPRSPSPAASNPPPPAPATFLSSAFQPFSLSAFPPGPLLASVLAFLRRSLAAAAAAGIPADRIALDPGIGFGKTQPQNVALLRHLDALHVLGHPLLLGISRKSVFSHLLPELTTPAERLEATLAATSLAVRQGVQIHRVHDVAAARRAALTAAALTP